MREQSPGWWHLFTEVQEAVGKLKLVFILMDH